MRLLVLTGLVAAAGAFTAPQIPGFNAQLVKKAATRARGGIFGVSMSSFLPVEPAKGSGNAQAADSPCLQNPIVLMNPITKVTSPLCFAPGVIHGGFLSRTPGILSPARGSAVKPRSWRAFHSAQRDPQEVVEVNNHGACVTSYRTPEYDVLFRRPYAVRARPSSCCQAI